MKNDKYYGTVDMLDLVKYTVDLFAGETEEAWTDFFEKRDDFRNTTVDEIMKTPGWASRCPVIDPFRPVLSDSSMLSVWELFGRSKIKRVALLNRREDLVGIMTQSMCISLLRQNLHRLGNAKNTTVREMMKNLPSTVHVINESKKAIDAFNMMSDKDVSGLAIVNDSGVLTGAISIRDLRGVGASGELFSSLYRTVVEFKESVRRDFPRQAPRTHYSTKSVPVSGLYVTPANTFEDVMLAMNDGCIHRIFVCSEASALKGQPQPTSIISQSDMLMHLLTQLGLPPIEM